MLFFSVYINHFKNVFIKKKELVSLSPPPPSLKPFRNRHISVFFIWKVSLTLKEYMLIFFVTNIKANLIII